ncbi:MAG: carbohydrate kinase [Bacteroidota bacterium]|jgi:fructokinase
MPLTQNYICCFGEVLWDLLPSGKLPGGAPMNVATHLQNLGISSAMISRVGNDELGDEIKAFLQDKNCTLDFIQTDNQYPTGKVNVFLSEKHEATYEIVHPVAWDFISISPELLELVKNSKGLIFGTLAARDVHTKETLLGLIEVAPLKIFDVNLRPPHYSQALIETLLQKADIVKMNEDELEIITAWYGFITGNDEQRLTQLKEKFILQTLIVTKGGDGAIVLDKQGFFQSKGFKVTVMDTIGSGDSFLAGFLKNYLAGNAPEYALNYACALGALVASHKGANPPIEEKDILKMLEK